MHTSIRLAKSVAAVVAVLAAVLFVGASGAQAVHWPFTGTPGGMSPGQRYTTPVRTYNYGAGMYSDMWNNQYACVGAKDNANGTGGNAIPFTCATMNAGQTVWTPGGTYGYGYGTLINSSSSPISIGGILNIR
jgi:hypothetical protein